MLHQISISNYAIVDQLDLEITSGMTAITGETGAGKSIMMDALNLALGGRADSDCVRSEAKRADIQARFNLENIPAGLQWLKEKDYDLENSSECILRRVITRDGRSRAYINGITTTLTELRDIGSHLIDIHSQHANQSLLNKSNHFTLLDHFAKTTSLAKKVSKSAFEYHQARNKLNALVSHQQERDERTQLLSYQLQELEQIDLQQKEVETLEKEHQQQSQAEKILSACQQVCNICGSEDNINLLQQLNQCHHILNELQLDDTRLNDCMEMLSSAHIQIKETVGELNQFVDHFESNPERAQFIEERLSAIYELARKHRIQPHELLIRKQALKDELNKVHHHEVKIVELHAALEQLQIQYYNSANQLSQKRKYSARKLETLVNDRLALLGMPKGKFKIQFDDIPQQKISQQGIENIEFLVTTNPGQPPRPLCKTASGGELSRISLAIQVIIAQSTNTPTLIFDEVDVGIGGGTAEIVGNMLKEIGNKGQVICVTHQPQVASRAHQHLHVSKKSNNVTSSTQIQKLEGSHRVTEIARMLGGIKITSPTLNHAQEMLLHAQTS